ncbi:MAG: hypothetical protein JWM78_1819 [Verrucomicrobiaceae bacterium]|nr:hypothetical protein [Verrucomicrobiaceae bacterium]
MNIQTIKKTVPAIVTAASVIVLILLSIAIIDVIKSADRRYVSNHIMANLDSIASLIKLMSEDDIDRVRVIAETNELVILANAVIAAPADQSATSALAAWITTSYRSRGFVGYSIINRDYVIVAASSPAYVGQPATPLGKAAMQRALVYGASDSPPVSSQRPVIDDGHPRPQGTLYQLACARIVLHDSVVGFLCLRSDPTLRLFKLLEAARTGETGEAYVVDGTGRILSPSRFEENIKKLKAFESGWSAYHLFAREPAMQRVPNGAKQQNGPLNTAPLTLVAERLLQTKSANTGYLENYPDYRGKPVVGAGRWLPEMDMGVVVEEDWAEAFYASQISRYAVWGFTAVAAALIIFLTIFQRRVRQNLMQSEMQHRAFREHSPNGTVLRDVDGVIQMANRAFEELRGTAPGESSGKTDWELCSTEVAKIYVGEHKKALRCGALTTLIHYFPHTGVTVSILSFPVKNVDETEVIGVGMVVSDISVQVQAQHELETLNRDLEIRVDNRTKELAEARDAAEAGARAKSDFLANMSHEIRTPMNAIIGMSYLALNGTLPSQARNYVEKIRNAGQHLLGIINSILDYSKIEAGKLTLDNAPFSLQQLIGHVIDFVGDKADEKGLQLQVELDPHLPMAFIGDSLRIGQILINFCSNAVKFTQTGGVTLGVSTAGTEADFITLRFAVSDTGLGISDASLQQLFKPFSQVDNSSTRQFEGTGLGLAICKSLAELLGGTISARSALGVGSTFTFEVALAAAEQPELQNYSGAPRHVIARGAIDLIDLSHKRVLLVEDNDINQEVAVAILRSFGTQVSVANNGAEAVQMVKAETFDVVLMDMQMPVLDGVAATRAIRADSANAQPLIIAMTANALPGDRERCLEAGMNDYVAKPIEPAQLLATLSHWLGQPRSLDAAPLNDGVREHGLPHTQLQALGLDTAKAINLLLGRESLYARIMQRFVEERADLPQQFAVALQLGDFAAAMHLVHSLKSLAGTIGAQGLQKICAGIERDLETEHIDREQLAAFNTEVARLIDGLRPLLGALGLAQRV